MKHKKIFNIMLYTNFFSINRKNSFGYNIYTTSRLYFLQKIAISKEIEYFRFACSRSSFVDSFDTSIPLCYWGSIC